MSKVKFIGNLKNYTNLNRDEVYDVIQYISEADIFWDKIIIMIKGKEVAYFLNDGNGYPIFKDVTIEYRNELIERILE